MTIAIIAIAVLLVGAIAGNLLKGIFFVFGWIFSTKYTFYIIIPVILLWIFGVI